MFYTLGYDPIQLSFVVQIVSALIAGAFSWLCPFDIPLLS